MLKTNATLHRLDVRENAANTASIVALADVLTHDNSTLEELGTGNNDNAVRDADQADDDDEPASFFRDKGLIALADMLEQNTSLLRLHICMANVDLREGPLALIGAMKHNRSLQLLQLDKAYLGDRGAIAAASMLDANSSLVTLNVRACNIGAVGHGALADSLKRNTTLLKLDMGEGVDDAVFDAVRARLRENTQILARRGVKAAH